ncbi:DUF6232 family protein [Streptacidiphilus sp. MAP5-3]|uniref:DUF6232 family protein n=1 Tax=unclassified Streptacidiphilus TaxID=2643834 RepID=UPI0035110451
MRRTATPPPPIGRPSASPRRELDLRVTERVLWVGHAAYPIRNIARVFTFELRPRYGLAVFRFFWRTAVTLAALGMFSLLDALANSTGDQTGQQSGVSGWLVFLWFVGVALIITYVVQLVQVLSENPHPALAIETSGPSTALVTLPERRELDRLVDAIVGAIEHPGPEAIYQVQRLHISKPSNYYFGDVVNMYGGSSNMGMVKS